MTEKEKALEDIEIIKSMMDRTKEAIDPAAPIIILWGILCFLGNIVTHFLVIQVELHRYIPYTWWGIAAFGVVASSIMGYRIGLRRYKYGINHYVSRKLALIWTIIVPVGISWSLTAQYSELVSVETVSLFWAILYTIGVYITGIFYSKEFIFGGIVIFLGTILSVIFLNYHSLIIGIFMGGGTTVPAIIAHKRFKKTMRDSNES